MSLRQSQPTQRGSKFLRNLFKVKPYFEICLQYKEIIYFVRGVTWVLFNVWMWNR